MHSWVAGVGERQLETPATRSFILLRLSQVCVKDPIRLARIGECDGELVIILHAVRIDVLVPRLLPRNTLLPRLLPRELATGGRSLQCSAFQGWSLGTRIDSLIPSCVEYNTRHPPPFFLSGRRRRPDRKNGALSWICFLARHHLHQWHKAIGTRPLGSNLGQSNYHKAIGRKGFTIGESLGRSAPCD